MRGMTRPGKCAQSHHRLVCVFYRAVKDENSSLKMAIFTDFKDLCSCKAFICSAARDIGHFLRAADFFFYDLAFFGSGRVLPYWALGSRKRLRY